MAENVPPKPTPKPDTRQRDRTTPPPQPRPDPDHEGATEDEVGDRTGPGAGYDEEPERVRDRGGVSES